MPGYSRRITAWMAADVPGPQPSLGEVDRPLHSVPDSDVGADCTSGRDVRGRGGIACGGDAAGPVDSILPSVNVDQGAG